MKLCCIIHLLVFIFLGPANTVVNLCQCPHFSLFAEVSFLEVEVLGQKRKGYQHTAKLSSKKGPSSVLLLEVQVCFSFKKKEL